MQTCSSTIKFCENENATVCFVQACWCSWPEIFSLTSTLTSKSSFPFLSPSVTQKMPISFRCGSWMGVDVSVYGQCVMCQCGCIWVCGNELTMDALSFPVECVYHSSIPLQVSMATHAQRHYKRLQVSTKFEYIIST